MPLSCSTFQERKRGMLGCPGKGEGPNKQHFCFCQMALVTCFGLAKGRAPTIDCVELKAEYRILFCASCLWSRLVCPRSHLNR